MADCSIKSSSAPRLTIGMPVFNGARYLREALDTLLGQTFGDFELIVSDNASSDETESIGRQYAARDPRIRYVRHEVNRGAAWNFNFVVKQARGELFKWAASDDLCAPTFLERCIEVLDRDPSVIFCHSFSCRIDSRGRLLTELGDPTEGDLPKPWFGRPYRRPDASSPVPHRRFRDVLLSTGWATRSYGVVRTAVLCETRLLQPYYGSEKITFAELALRGRCYDVPEMLFCYRYHQASASQLTTAAAQQEYIAAQPTARQCPRLQLLRGYCRAIWESPIGLYQKGRCLGWLFRYLFQVYKWGRIARGTWLGQGMGPVSSKRRQRREHSGGCEFAAGNELVTSGSDT